MSSVVNNLNNFQTNSLNNNLNTITHKPPTYDIYGYLKPTKSVNLNMNELNNINVPWKSDVNQEPMTRTKLLENRRKEKIPDITYDLDRDGFVGGRDYFIAKKFDKDQDGKLNEIERKAAYEAIYNNYEDQYVWNLENQGSKRDYRIMQRRGKIIDADNFMPIQETYPRHPLSSKLPMVKSLSELKSKRKEVNREDIDKKMSEFSKNNPTQIITENIAINTSKPKFATYSEYKEFNKKMAREKVGLKPENDEITSNIKIPSLDYVYEPKNKTQSDLKQERKKENYEQFKKLASVQYKDETQRLQERENEIFYENYKDHDRQTIKKIKENRKKETLDYNMKTFSKQTIGVHGHELPKFSETEDLKEYWKYKDGYVENPKLNSHVQFKENVKYWKKAEELLLNEHKDEIIPYEKEYHKPQKVKEDLILKVNKLNHFKNFDPDNPVPIDPEKATAKHVYRWTSLVHQFCPHKFKEKRFFDALYQKEAQYNLESDSVLNKIAFESKYMQDLLKKKDEYKSLKTGGDGDRNDQSMILRDNLYLRMATKETPRTKEPGIIRTKGF